MKLDNKKTFSENKMNSRCFWQKSRFLQKIYITNLNDFTIYNNFDLTFFHLWAKVASNQNFKFDWGRLWRPYNSKLTAVRCIIGRVCRTQCSRQVWTCLDTADLGVLPAPQQTVLSSHFLPLFAPLASLLQKLGFSQNIEVLTNDKNIDKLKSKSHSQTWSVTKLTSLGLNQSPILIPIPKSILKSNPNWESKNLDQSQPFYYLQTIDYVDGERRVIYSKAKDEYFFLKSVLNKRGSYRFHAFLSRQKSRKLHSHKIFVSIWKLILFLVLSWIGRGSQADLWQGGKKGGGGWFECPNKEIFRT